ncbi:MAG TPA: malectin domain-containing carbohydrate-binding protein [Chloroflexota bacterium]
MRHIGIVLALLFGLLARAIPAQAQTAPICPFVLGFAAIQALIPLQVGACLESEHHNPVNGDALQRTSGGLLVWRKADNFTAFTDGYYTWVSGPFGLQRRLNSERFPWEARPTIVRIKPGSPYTDSNGNIWGMDDSYVVSNLFTTYIHTTLSPIGSTVDQALYQTERYGQSFTYRFFLLNGPYTITLKFAEIYWQTVGHRRFRVAINGLNVLDNFDILSQVAPDAAFDKSFPVDVTDGILTLAFTAQLDESKISAIQVSPRSP